VLVIGVPSMRLLKVIGVYTPEPWQGWGFGAEDTHQVLAEGEMNNQPITWADTHHPALSETDGDYDGQWLFINDDPLMASNHGGAFVTPNTEYVIEAAQYAAPLDGSYAPLSEYEEKYRGAITFWKFDRDAGRLNVDETFVIELPPYWQDLSDAGKGPSFGWAFLNSFCSEMATGGIMQGNPPFEAGCSANDMDYMAIVNWQAAAEVAAQPGKTVEIQGRTVIPRRGSSSPGSWIRTRRSTRSRRSSRRSRTRISRARTRTASRS
jgi:nitrous-oxide reductase